MSREGRCYREGCTEPPPFIYPPNEPRRCFVHAAADIASLHSRIRELEAEVERLSHDDVQRQDAIRRLHDAIDEANAKHGGFDYDALCLLCESGDADGTGIVHFDDCPINEARRVLAEPTLQRRMGNEARFLEAARGNPAAHGLEA